METYEFEVCLTVKVQAFTESDAYDLLNDTFGPGEDAGIEIVTSEIKER